jgi:hypothetical protein
MSSMQQVLTAGPPVSVKGPRQRTGTPLARRGFPMGNRLCRALCGGVLPLRCLPLRLCGFIAEIKLFVAAGQLADHSLNRRRRASDLAQISNFTIAARIGYRQCVLVLRRVNPDKRFAILLHGPIRGCVLRQGEESGSQQTHRWREMDSNFWSRGTKARDFRNRGRDRRGPRCG